MRGRELVRTAPSAGRGHDHAGRVQLKPPSRDRQVIISPKTLVAVIGIKTDTCLGWLRTKRLSTRGRRRQLLSMTTGGSRGG